MDKTRCTVYIDEAGDLGIGRGTNWFIISAVIVDKDKEKQIREIISSVKSRLNLNKIHFREIKDFGKRSVVVSELSKSDFVYINIIVDTNKLSGKIPTTSITYNYICRMLLERASWYLRDTNRTGDIILSARGTSRDNELIEYIKNKLIPYPENQIVQGVFDNITAKTASSWDLLQLADVCATTMFLTFEKNGWGFRTPCFSKALASHLYRYNKRLKGYGLKYYENDMEPSGVYFKENLICT